MIDYMFVKQEKKTDKQKKDFNVKHLFNNKWHN